MNFLQQHAGSLVGWTGLGAGASFLALFQGMIRDTWTDWRLSRRAAAARAAVAALPTSGGGADRIGAEVTHQLVDLLRQDLADRRTEESRRWEVVSSLADALKSQAASLSALHSKQDQAQTILQVLAARP